MSDRDAIDQVSGKRVQVMYGGGLVPQMFGKTTFTLYSDRLVEDSAGVVLKDHTQVPLNAINGVNICTHGNPILLFLGIFTLWFFGLGLIFLVLYFFIRKNFLVVISEGHIYALQRKGPDSKYNDFAETLMDMVIAARTGGGVEEQATSPPSRRSAPAALAAPAASPKGATVSCNGCGAEYRMPAGSSGKKFRCTQCRTVVEVP